MWGEGETKPCLGRPAVREEEVLGSKVKEPVTNWKSAELQVNNNEEASQLLKDIDEVLKTVSTGVENNGVKHEEQNIFCIYDSESEPESEKNILN